MDSHSKRYGRTQLLSERVLADVTYLQGATERIVSELYAAALADGYAPLEEPTLVVTRETWPPAPDRPWWMRLLAAVGWSRYHLPRPIPSVMLRCEVVCTPISKIEWS